MVGPGLGAAGAELSNVDATIGKGAGKGWQGGPGGDKGNLRLPPRRVGCREVAQPRLLLLALPLCGCHGNTGLVLPSDIKMLLPAE